MRAFLPLIALAVLALLAGAAAHAGSPLADPTRPMSAGDSRPAATEPGGVRVQAIMIRPDSRVALVDGRLVHAGDRIANLLIEAVTPEGVRYSQDGHSRFARLRCPSQVTVRRGAPSPRDVP
jgi:hypothetical protein